MLDAVGRDRWVPGPEVPQGAGGTGEGAEGEVDDLFHVAPAALGFQELLVPGGDVGVGQVRVGGAEQVLAVQVLLGLDLGGVDAEQPAGG